jgi:hypothetical protein
VKAVAEAAAAKTGTPLNRFLFTGDGQKIPEDLHTYAPALAKMRERDEHITFGPAGPAMLKIDALVGAAMVELFWNAHRKKTHDEDIPNVTKKPYWLPRDYRRANHKVPPQRPAARKTPLWLMDRVAISLPSIGVLAEGDRSRGAVARRPVRLQLTASPAW